MTDSLSKRLDNIRRALLSLHKALLDSERVNYERTVGTIQSSHEFLQLLLHDSWFAWLRLGCPQLVVAMDEALEAEEPLTAAAVAALVEQTRLALTASEDGEGAARQYFDALQRDPGVVLAHADVMRELRSSTG